MHDTKPDNDSHMGCGSIDESFLPFVKPQLYDLAFDFYETKKLFGGRALKLALWFRIITPGEYFEVTIPRYYNLKAIKGKPQKFGDFKVGRNSDFIREYTSLFDLPKRVDRIPMTIFEKNIIIGKVGTVKTGYEQRNIPAPLQYSVIKQLVEVKRL